MPLNAWNSRRKSNKNRENLHQKPHLCLVLVAPPKVPWPKPHQIEVGATAEPGRQTQMDRSGVSDFRLLQYNIAVLRNSFNLKSSIYHVYPIKLCLWSDFLISKGLRNYYIHISIARLVGLETIFSSKFHWSLKAHQSCIGDTLAPLSWKTRALAILEAAKTRPKTAALSCLCCVTSATYWTPTHARNPRTTTMITSSQHQHNIQYQPAISNRILSNFCPEWCQFWLLQVAIRFLPTFKVPWLDSGLRLAEVRPVASCVQIDNAPALNIYTSHKKRNRSLFGVKVASCPESCSNNVSYPVDLLSFFNSGLKIALSLLSSELCGKSNGPEEQLSDDVWKGSRLSPRQDLDGTCKASCESDGKCWKYMKVPSTSSQFNRTCWQSH